jgi:hypothetical protein
MSEEASSAIKENTKLVDTNGNEADEATRSNYDDDDDYDYDINDNGGDEDEKLFVTSSKKVKVTTATTTTTTSSSTSSDEIEDDEDSNSNSKTSKVNCDKKDESKVDNDSSEQQENNNTNKEIEEEAAKCLEQANKTLMEEKAKVLGDLHGNVNYAIILAFLDKFASHLSLKDLTFATLESYFTATKTLPRKFIELHLKLMKNLPMGKHAKKDKWELYMAKFVRRFSHKDAQLIENNEYLSCDMSAKVNRKKKIKFCNFRKLIGISVYAEDPAYIVHRTDRTFLFFLGVTSGILCATMYFFFNYFGSIFTQIRLGHKPQKSFFICFILAR